MRFSRAISARAVLFRGRGAALLVALFLIVLVGTFAVLWLAGLRTTRRAESASLAQRRAGALESLALEETLGALREAARTGSLTPEAPFYPRAPKFALPPRRLPPALEADPGLAQLLAISSAPLDDPLGPAASSQALDQGKRSLPAPDLNSPRLGPADGALSPGDVYWIYLGETGPLTEAQARAAPREVIGRYGFMLWNLGGTLDLNHAGHPELAEVAALETWTSRRGSLRQLRPEALPGADQGLDALLAWREPITSFSAYRQLAEQFAPAVSGLDALHGTQRFLTRKDMLRTIGQVAPDLGVAHRYSMFSRGLAEPAARLEREHEEEERRLRGLASARAAAERPLSTGVVLPAGSPVLARRFALERLDLLSYEFPASVNEDLGRMREIRRWFGLFRETSAAPWNYVGSRADGELAEDASLRTLEEIAEETPAREPNFFETLRAAIPAGSLGQHLPGGPSQSAAELQKHPDLHLFQLGLNLIDQWDADSYPTVLEVSPPGWTGAPIRLSGVENLPYLSQLHLDCLNPFWWRTEAVPYEDRRLIPYLIPELWMPHQPALTAPPTSPRWHSTSGDPAAGPRAIRLRLEGTVLLDLRENATQHAEYTADSGALVIGAEEFASFGPVPRPVLNAMARDGCWDNGGFTYRGESIDESDDGRLPNTSFYAARLTPQHTVKEITEGGFDARPLAPQYPRDGLEYPRHDGTKSAGKPYWGMTLQGATPATQFWGFTTNDPDPPCLRVELGNRLVPEERFDVVMDYLDHQGNWVPYTSFAAGSPNHAATHGLGNPTASAQAFLFSSRLFSHGLDPAERRRYLDAGGAVTLFKGDPRTARLGVALADSNLTSATVRDNFLAGHGGMPPRSPMRWASVFDLESERWAPDPLNVGAHLSVPNAYTEWAGGYFGRGFMNQHFDFELSKNSPIRIAQFSGGETLYRAVGFPPNRVRPHFFPGLFGENIRHPFADDSLASRESYYIDPDDIVRPGDGWLWRHALDRAHDVEPGNFGDEEWLLARSANTLYSNQATFPRVLNRPFQSVAELGHVFRDLPQRSLDFSSAVSADAALLDVFCLRETPLHGPGRALVSGVLNPASAPPEVLAALLTGVAQAEPQVAYAFPAPPFHDQREQNIRHERTPALPAVGQEAVNPNLARVTMSPDSARLESHPLAQRFTGLNASEDEALLPPESAADLVLALADNDADPTTPADPAQRPQLAPMNATAYGVRAFTGADEFPQLANGASVPFPAVKAEREAALRALADITEFRVWNLFLDTIVEVGAIPRGAAPQNALDEFTPQARRRAWYHIAIDRTTGAVLEVQRERAEF